MRYFLSFLLITLFLFQSCKEEPTTLEDFLGKWTEETDNTGAFGGEDLEITFSEDNTFTMKIDGWTDAINAGDPCGFSWTYYVRGTFTIATNTIDFTGFYTDETYTTDEPNCGGETELFRTYLFDFRKEELFLNAGASNEFKLVKG